MHTWRDVRGGRPRARLDDLRSHVADKSGAAGCSAAPAHASGHGLPIAKGARRAGAVSAPAARCSPSQQAQQPDGSSAKRALRAAVPPVLDTAGHGRHSAAGRRKRSVGPPRRATRKVAKGDAYVPPPRPSRGCTSRTPSNTARAVNAMPFQLDRPASESERIRARSKKPTGKFVPLETYSWSRSLC